MTRCLALTVQPQKARHRSSAGRDGQSRVRVPLSTKMAEGPDRLMSGASEKHCEKRYDTDAMLRRHISGRKTHLVPKRPVRL